MIIDTRRRFTRLLDPIDRVSEVLFGLIMVLTSTTTLSVVSAGRPEVKTMVLGALGCNLAWGIIDAGMYLMECLDSRGRDSLLVGSIKKAVSREHARQLIADALPSSLTAALSRQQLESLRRTIVRSRHTHSAAALTKEDALSAFGICLLVFLSTFPVVIPFFFFDDVQLALRVSNAIAIAMLFLCGYAFAHCTGHRPWPTGLVMVSVGCALVGVAIALGG